MTTLQTIKKAQQKVARLERQRALQTLKKRKQDTQRKIEWGGLIIKAKLHNQTKAVILGALIDAKQQIDASHEVKRLFEIKGHSAFLGKVGKSSH